MPLNEALILNREDVHELNKNVPLIDVPAGFVTPDKADSFNIGMVAYPINCRDCTVHNIQHTIG